MLRQYTKEFATNLRLAWPVMLGIVTLIIVLAKMHGDIIVLKEKVKSLLKIM